MSAAAPVVAVLIPAHNAAPWLGTALDSVRQQTLAPQQVVVVDDGSTDDTAAIAERMGAQVVRQAQRGPGAARNRALAATGAEFVAFLDADDWYAPDKLERSVEQLRELGAACLCSDAWLVVGDRVVRRKNDHRIVPQVLTYEQLLRGNPVVCSTVVARRAAIAAAGGFDESAELIASEDYDLWLRLAAREPIAYLADALTFYRVAPGSLSGNERFLRGVDRILDKVLAAHPGEAHYANLVRRRRAELRLDVAWDLLQARRGADARRWLAEAWRFAPTAKGARMWLRSLIAR